MDGLISVIIPVYNVEQYLHECVDSVLGQTYQNFEIILVNDGSTDSSGMLCEEYAEQDDRIRVIHKENGGASAARNVGLDMMKGEYVYFLDSDDWLDNKAFEKILKIMHKENADVVFFDAYAVDETQGIRTKEYYSHKKVYTSGKGTVIMEELLSNKEFHVTPWHMFFKKTFLEKEKIQFVEGIIYEDMIFAYQVFSTADRVAYIPEYLYSRRFRANSVMTSEIKEKNFKSACEVYYQVRDYSKNILTNGGNKGYIARCAYNVLNIYEKIGKEDKQKFREEYIQIKIDILENNAYEDKALKMRCYGKTLWLFYKIPQKIFQMFSRKGK